MQVLQCKPELLVDTFILLMPVGSQSMTEFARICEMKVCAGTYCEILQGASIDSKPSRGPWVQIGCLCDASAKELTFL